MTQKRTADHDPADDAIAAALDWQARLERPDADWDAFTAWLESDAEHGAAMAAIDTIDAALDLHREALRDLAGDGDVDADISAATDDVHHVGARRLAGRRWHWPALAAALAFAFLLPFATSWMSPGTVETYRADGGQPVEIAFERGSTILLARRSALSLNRKAQTIELASGSAFFDVRHKPDRTLQVSAGDWEVSDIGTQFSLTSGPAGLVVAVGEGKVSVRRKSDDRAAAIEVAAGKRLVVLANSSRATLSTIAPDAVAAWREGRLTYDAMPIEMVAQDISRYLGKPVAIDPALAGRTFSGTLVGDNGEQLIAGLEAIMAIDSRDEGGRVVLGTSRR